jgi:hypothetical protein
VGGGLAALALGDELIAIRALESELAAIGGPLAQKAAGLAAQRATTEAAIAAHTQAEIDLGRARSEARLAKQACNRARDMTHGALLQRLPGQRRLVASFFRPTASSESPASVSLPPHSTHHPRHNGFRGDTAPPRSLCCPFGGSSCAQRGR